MKYFCGIPAEFLNTTKAACIFVLQPFCYMTTFSKKVEQITTISVATADGFVLFLLSIYFTASEW